MGRYRFATFETCDLPIGEGDTITVRRRLSAGQRMTLNARTTEWFEDPETGRQRPRPKLFRTALETAVAYLVEWSLSDLDGRPMPIAGLGPEELADTLANLDEDTFRAIQDAIEQHVSREEAARAEEKKAQAPASA